jgi:hypothetical protein
MRLALAEIAKASGAPGWKSKLADIAQRAKVEQFSLYARRAAVLQSAS